MYTVKDASVAYSLMGQRLQPSNTSLILDEYFCVCKLYGDTATARETHQRYVTQVESMRGMFTSQTLRNSEHEAFRDASAARQPGASAKVTHAQHSSSPATGDSSMRRGGSTGAASASTSLVPAESKSGKKSNEERGPQPLHASLAASPGNASLPAGESSRSLEDACSPRRQPEPAASTAGSRAVQTLTSTVQRSASEARRTHAAPHVSIADHRAAASEKENASSAAADSNVRSAASYAILRREWGHENYEEQFHKPWNAFLRELSGVMTEVVTAWVSDLDECTPYSQHLVRRSSTCCYDAAHGMCLLRWNTMREVRAYVDALHAVVNAPLSSFFVPLTLGMQVLGVPVLCMSLAPVTGPWQGWDTVTVVWHSFCGMCANLRLMRPLDRAEGGRSETSIGPLMDSLANGGSAADGAAGAAPHAVAGSGGVGNALERSVAWSLLRQLEPPSGSNDYSGNANSGGGAGVGAVSGYDGSPHSYTGASAAAWEGRRNSVFRGDPTTLATSASGMVDRVSRQVFAAAAAGQGGPFARSGGLQLTPAIGADARWYFIDARAICLYQWYARSSWTAARVPRREMFHTESGCVQRSVGPNKLILQSKLRIMVGQLLNGLLRFGGNGGTATSGLSGSAQQGGPGGNSTAHSQRSLSRGKPPILLSTLCHSNGVRYGTYVYAIVDLLRTEEASLDEAVQKALRLGSSSPNKYEVLKQCRRCIQAVVGELLARAIKHLIYQEWYMVMRQNPDWLHRFQSLCSAVAEADEWAATMATADTTAAAAVSASSPTGQGGADQSGTLISAPARASAAQKTVVATAGCADSAATNTGAASVTLEAAHHVLSSSSSSNSSSSVAAFTERRCTTPSQGTNSSVNSVVALNDAAQEEMPCGAAAAEEKRDAETLEGEEGTEDKFGGVAATLRHRRLLSFIDETRQSLGVPLLEVVRRVLNGVFTVNMNAGGTGTPSTLANNSNNNNVSSPDNGVLGTMESAGTLSGSGAAGNSLEQQSISPLVPNLSNGSVAFSGAGVSITESSNRYMTDEAGRSLATSSTHALGGFPVFNQQLSAVAFRPSMFEELLLAVNEQYVVRPYSGNEKMSEWQLLHKRAPVITRRGLYARTPPSASSASALSGVSGNASGGTAGAGVSNGSGGGSGGGGGGTGGGAGNSGSGGGESWLARGASRSSLGAASASAPASSAPKRGRNPSRLRGTIPVYYPAADEESIQVEAKDLFPGWSLQCLEEMIGIPLVLRQNRVDIDGGFTGADALRALSPSMLPSSAANGEGRVQWVGATLAARAPLSTGCPLRSAVWGTTLELPLCLHSGSVEGALEYAQHQREIGIAIVSSGLSSPFLGHGRGGTASALWRERNPHAVYMGKLIQLHAADVRIACRGWPIMEDFDFLKHSDQPNERMLSGPTGRLAWPRRRTMESPLAQRQNETHAQGGTAVIPMNAYSTAGSGGNSGGVGGELAAMSASGEDALAALAFNAAMHARLSLLNAHVDLHEAMSSMWHLTECMESMNGSHVVYGYLLRKKIQIIATVAAQFTASGVTTALEAAIADLDVLTGGIFNFSSIDNVGAHNSQPTSRSLRNDVLAGNTFGRRVNRSPGRPPPRSPFSPSDRRVTRPAPFPMFPNPTGSVEASSHFPGTPFGSQTPTLDPSQRVKPSVGMAGAAEVATGSAATVSVDRLRSVPLPPPITQRQVAVVAAAARRAPGAPAEVPNPLSMNTPLLDSEEVADTHMSITTRTMGLHGTAPSSSSLISAIGAFKSFTLRSVQCVDLYTTLLELLTRHMLLPGAHRTPKESLSRAVMFCSLRRELIVMTHGENSVEAAMAASDVGLLLLQNPKTWPQAKTEFYRARRSITYHLRELVEGGVRGRGGGAAERQLAASSAAFEASVLGAQFSASVFVQDGRGGLSMNDSIRPRELCYPPMPPTRTQHVTAQGGPSGTAPLPGTANARPSSPSSPGGGAQHTWTVVRRDSWKTAPDRLKQALCSVLNNIAYLFCRQAQQQYMLNQQSMTAFVRNARRQHTLHKPSTGMQLHERRLRRTVKVEHFLNEAFGTLQGVLQHTSDIPVYDYAVALNNQACVLFHRYQYNTAKRLLLQSLRITMQLQSFSVAPVELPSCLVGAKGNGELGSVLWLLDSAQLQATPGQAVAAAAPATNGGSGQRGGYTEGKHSVGDEEDGKASTTNAKRRPVAVSCSPPSIANGATTETATISGAPPSTWRENKSSAQFVEGYSRRQPARAAYRCPNALTTIAEMLKDLGEPLGDEDEDVQDYSYYSATGHTPLHRGSARGAASSSPATAAATATSAATRNTPDLYATLSSPITVSSAEQVRRCQVHTLRMLYQVEVRKSFIDRLRIQQLFRRYLASWRERRQHRRAEAAAELLRFGAAAMTRVFLARRYRFSGYHWWLRQPREIRRHLDPQLDPQALTTRRQLWDVWNTQVERAALLLQRVLRGSAVRANLGQQHQFRDFYFTRCRPAVEEAVWQKMNLLYTSVLLHLHVREGLLGMAGFKEAVQSGAMWMSRVAEPLRAQQSIARIRIQLKELQRREALERDFLRTFARQRFSQMEVTQMKESVLLVIRSPRQSFSTNARAETPPSPPPAVPPQQQQPWESAASSLPGMPPLHSTAPTTETRTGTEGFTAHAHASPAAPPHSTKHIDILSLPDEYPVTPTAAAASPFAPRDNASATAAPAFKRSPLSLSDVARGAEAVTMWDYTPPAVFTAAPAVSPASATMMDVKRPSVPPSPAAPTPGFSRTRRARQVIIQADAADLDADVALHSPRSTAASEERHRQMQRQYREDERAKMSQLLRRHMEEAGASDPHVNDTDGLEGGGGSESTSMDGSSSDASRRREKEGEKTQQEGGGGGHSPVNVNTEDANAKWRHAVQRVGEPRASLRSDSLADRHSAAHSSLIPAWPSVNRDAEKDMRASPPPPSTSPFAPETISAAPAPSPSPPPPRQEKLTLPRPDSLVAMLPFARSPNASSSAAVSSSATSAASSRVAVAAAEAQRRQLLNASQLLLQFWWSKRALPTFVSNSITMHRLYNEHCCAVHALWLRETATRVQLRELIAVEGVRRYEVWQGEAVGRASLLLLQVHGARCCREIGAHAKLLATMLTSEERRGRAAVLLAAAARDRQGQLSRLPPQK